MSTYIVDELKFISHSAGGAKLLLTLETSNLLIVIKNRIINNNFCELKGKIEGIPESQSCIASYTKHEVAYRAVIMVVFKTW